MFGHINNAIYYSLMDDAINAHLINRGCGIEYPRFVAENSMRYLCPLKPFLSVDVGIRVVKLSSRSVTYDVGFFQQDSVEMAARGKFVHVYVDAKSHRPIPIAAPAREVLEEILAS